MAEELGYVISSCASEALGGSVALNEDYSPQYDVAVGRWARRSPKVARIVHAVDAERIRLITRIFRVFGYGATEANIRGRITYYHQIGY